MYDMLTFGCRLCRRQAAEAVGEERRAGRVGDVWLHDNDIIGY